MSSAFSRHLLFGPLFTALLILLPSPISKAQQTEVSRIVNPLTDNIRPETEQNKKIYDSKYGDWGAPYPPSGNKKWVKIPVYKGSHNGVGLRNNLFPNGTEGWVSYNLRMVNWNSDDGMKLPGISGNVTSGVWRGPEHFKTTIGGNGGGGAGGIHLGPENKGKSWSARMFIGGGPNNPDYRGRLGYYLYHKDSNNVHSDGRVFGTMGWWTQNGVESREVLDEKWHNVKMYVKLNDIGKNNGILRGYYDGRLAYERTNLSFADNPKYRNVALYFNVYHGGSKVAPDDYEVHVDNIRYNAGSRDLLGDGSSTENIESSEQRAEQAELLGDPTYTATEIGADISFFISDYSQAYIEYGENKSNTLTGPPEESFKYKDHLQRLRGLQPGTTYYYRIHFVGERDSGQHQTSEWFSLTTNGQKDREVTGNRNTVFWSLVERLRNRRSTQSNQQLSENNGPTSVVSEVNNPEEQQSSLTQPESSSQANIQENQTNAGAVLTLVGTPEHTVTSDSASINFLFSDYSQAYIEYGENKTNTLTSAPEESFKYKDHTQSLTNLEAGTTYYYRIRFSGENSSSQNLASEWFSLTTKKDENNQNIETNGYQRVLNPIAERDMSVAGQLGSSSMGSWGGPPPPSGASEWLRVPVRTGDFYGTGYKVPVLPNSTEGWISYQIRLDNWEKSKHSMKIPGPSATVTGNAPSAAAFPTAIGGNGGGGAGGTTGGRDGKGKSWSARMMISGVNHEYTSKAQLGYELYHRDSTNIHSDGRQFGEPEWWDKNGWNTANIRDGNWHRVKHYIKLNDIGKSNGILRGYLNGKLSYERTNISFADNPKYRQLALFMNVYHGGSIPATDNFAVYIDDIRFNPGSVDRTD